MNIIHGIGSCVGYVAGGVGSFFNRVAEYCCPTKSKPVKRVLTNEEHIHLPEREQPRNLMSDNSFLQDQVNTRLSPLDKSIKDFDGLSLQDQVNAVKTMTSDFDSDNNSTLISELIKRGKLNHIENFQAFTDGCIIFFEKVAKNNSEGTKCYFLTDMISLLRDALRQKDMSTRTSDTIDRIKLHQSLDNLIIASFSNANLLEFAGRGIAAIKALLPLSPEEQIDLDCNNVASRNVETRSVSLKNLSNAYVNARNQQVEIIEAFMLLLKDNINCDNGIIALNQINAILERDKTKNHSVKLKALIDGFANFLIDPGKINDENIVFIRIISLMLPSFIRNYGEKIKVNKLDLTKLDLALEKIVSSCSDDSLIKKIKRVQSQLKQE